MGHHLTKIATVEIGVLYDIPLQSTDAAVSDAAYRPPIDQELLSEYKYSFVLKIDEIIREL